MAFIDFTPAPLHRLVGRLQGLMRGRLWLKVLAGLLLGTLLGFALGPDLQWVSPSASADLVRWAAFPGELFLAMVQMIVVPLVFASIIAGLGASDDTDQLRTLGLRAAVYFGLTSTVAISLGIGLGYVLAPGKLVAPPTSASGVSEGDAAALPSLAELPDVLVGLLPANPLAALAEGQMLQIVLFAFVFGVALVVMPAAKATPMFDLLESLQGVCMTIVGWAMRLAPIAVFGLSVRLTATVGLDALAGMLAYVGTVLLGLVVLTGVYVVMAQVLGGCSPGRFLRAARDVQLLGFSTSSSAAVMPLSMRTAEEKLGVRPAMARFVIPLGATVNMDGTALYQGVAAVFLAQVFDVQLGPPAMVLIVITVVAASIGAPAAPGVGIVILSGVLASVGIPPSGVALLMGVDRLLDMARTSVNVTGDLTASLVLDRWVARSEAAAETESAVAPSDPGVVAERA